MANFEIKKYTVTITNIGEYGWVMLYDKDHINAATYRARLDFVSSGVGTVEQSGNFISVRIHVNFLESVIDVLRNEKPVYFNWWPSWAGVYTGPEPVGEAELGAP
jgi:hypothetical protein